MTTRTTKRHTDTVLGLIAGQGMLPRLIADEARQMGHAVIAVGLEGMAEESLAAHVDELKCFNVGKVGGILKFFHRHGITQAVFAGKVPKTALYGRSIRPDLKATRLLMKLKDRGDDSIINAISAVFKDEGIRLRDMKDFCPRLLTPEGSLTRRKLTRDEKNDIAFGFKMAKGIGKLDIGQTVVVKERAVMAVEAIEGTDKTIQRGGKLAGGGAVVIKVSRPGQDMRFDIPVAGPQTIDSMIRVDAAVLALEAGKSIIIELDRCLEKAAGAGIAIVGVRDGVTP